MFDVYIKHLFIFLTNVINPRFNINIIIQIKIRDGYVVKIKRVYGEQIEVEVYFSDIVMYGVRYSGLEWCMIQDRCLMYILSI